MLSLPPDLQQLAIGRMTIPSLCRLRECSKDYYQWTETTFLLSILLQLYPVPIPTIPYSFPILIPTIINHHFPFLSKLGSHELVLQAIEGDDPVMLYNIRTQLEVKLTGYFTTMIVKNKEKIIQSLFSDGFTLEETITNQIEWIKATGSSFFNSFPEGSKSISAKYICYHVNLRELLPLSHNDLFILRHVEVELILARGDPEEISEIEDDPPGMLNGGITCNYDDPEHQCAFARNMGPNKPKMLRQFLSGGKPDEHYVKEAVEAILDHLCRHPCEDGCCPLDPYNEEVFDFLGEYIVQHFEINYPTMGEIDDILELEEGTFSSIVNNMVRCGAVNTLRWLISVLPSREWLQHDVPSEDIPVSIRRVLREGI